MRANLDEVPNEQAIDAGQARSVRRLSCARDPAQLRLQITWATPALGAAGRRGAD